MLDKLERIKTIKDLFFRFQDRPNKERVDACARDTSFIPMTLLIDCCRFLKDSFEDLPRNVTKAIFSRYYKLRPVVKINQRNCPMCQNIGLEIVELTDPPFTVAMPCSCALGKRYEWMNVANDTAVVRYLKKRGWKFKDANQTQDELSF